MHDIDKLHPDKKNRLSAIRTRAPRVPYKPVFSQFFLICAIRNYFVPNIKILSTQ